METLPEGMAASTIVPGAQALAAKGQAFAGWLRKALDKSDGK